MAGDVMHTDAINILSAHYGNATVNSFSPDLKCK